MRHLNLILATCLLLILTAGALPGPAHAQDSVAASPPLNQQTRETIMERQRGLGLSGDYSLPDFSADRDAAPPPQPGAGVPQLGTRGAASDSDIWRALRDGSADATASSSTAAARLMQVIGDDWRHVRRTFILPYAGWIILGVIVLIALFYLIRGKIRIEGGRSGKTIPRFGLSHRVIHWFLAVTFILMALSGLILMLGRPLLLPLVGREVNAVLARGAILVHNYLGLVFVVALVLMILRFMKGNFFQRADLQWILKGGGLIGGHASSNHYNFGEKTWYWVVTLVGLAMSATGILLLFPWLTDNLQFHQAATLLHAVGAIGLICFALGHIYVGSVGMEGSLDSMLHGEVDENWAKEHHDLWYEEVTGKPVSHDDHPAPGGATPEGAG